MPTPDELVEIYDAGYFRDDPERPDREGYADYVGDAPAHRRNARRRLHMLAPYLDAPGRLLDVGCAAGFFVAEARSQGLEAEGIDVSRPMISLGREQVTDGLRAMSFAELELPPATLGAVTMWDYIEHSRDARADLAHAHEILEPNGVVALSTGDVESRWARWSGGRWHLLTPRHHNFFFGRTTVSRMLHEVGFELVRTKHEAAWYSVGHLLYKLESLVPGGIGRAGAHRLRRGRLGELELPVNLFDIVTVVARKRAGA